jgi:hypothetical protein
MPGRRISPVRSVKLDAIGAEDGGNNQADEQRQQKYWQETTTTTCQGTTVFHENTSTIILLDPFRELYSIALAEYVLSYWYTPNLPKGCNTIR